MAGSLVVVPSELHMEKSLTAIGGEQWEVQYSRFFTYPPPSRSSSNHPSLTPLRAAARSRIRGNWISSSPSSTASLNVSADHSSSGFILAVTFLGKIYEEHHISKLHFSWPHVSCVSGFPTRGTRAVFVSYKDCLGQIQKFALRFSTNCEVETFMNALKEIMDGGRDVGLPCGNFVSEISSQSEFVPSNESPYRPKEDWNSVAMYTDQMQSSLNDEVAQSSHSEDTVLNRDIEGILGALPPTFTSLVMRCHPVTDQPRSNFLSEISSQPKFVRSDESPYRPKQDWNSADTYTDQMQSSLNCEVAQSSNSQDTVPNGDIECILGAMPPSFSSLVKSCHPVAEQDGAPATASGDIDLKSQITRYLEDSSFQDMLMKVEKVLTEIGEDLLL